MSAHFAKLNKKTDAIMEQVAKNSEDIATLKKVNKISATSLTRLQQPKADEKVLSTSFQDDPSTKKLRLKEFSESIVKTTNEEKFAQLIGVVIFDVYFAMLYHGEQIYLCIFKGSIESEFAPSSTVFLLFFNTNSIAKNSFISLDIIIYV